jgi:hypothetical protein
MGYFSWICKGCGLELHEGETVRLNGCVGEYDGYGRAGSYDHNCGEPSAWHEKCYQAATDEQKLDDSPSKHAPNQGFDYTMAEYTPGEVTGYSIRAVPPYVEGSMELPQEHIINQHGMVAPLCLQDMESDDEDEQRALWEKVMPPEMVEKTLQYEAEVRATPIGEKDWDALNERWEELSPARPKAFATREEAEAAADAFPEGEWERVVLMAVKADGRGGAVAVLRGRELR